MEEKTEKRGHTYVVEVLDRSGSMDRIKKQTVDGHNEQVQVLREEADKPGRGETFASLVTFSGRITEEFFNAPVDILREMNDGEYNPNGSTAYYDAVGYAINKLCETTDPADEYNSYLVIVISDGEDTCSRVWNKASLNQRIAELEKTNRWTFTFLGANVNVGDYGFKNAMSFESTPIGTTTAFHSNARQVKKFLDGKAAAFRSGQKDYSMANYFEGASSADELAQKQAKDLQKPDVT